MAETTSILCVVEPVDFGASAQNKKNLKNVTAAIQIQGANGNRSIMLHKSQRMEFRFGDHIICTKGIVTLTFNPDHRHLSHAVALGHSGRLKPEIEINSQNVTTRQMTMPPDLKVYTLAGHNPTAFNK